LYEESLRHEFGHSISYGIARQRGEYGPLHGTADWKHAAEQDAATRTVGPNDFENASWAMGGPSTWVKLHRGDSDRKGFPTGVTEYGQNSAAEDFAESVALYTHDGPLGFVTRNGERKPVYFSDLFPGRAKLLAPILPKATARMKQLIRERGPL
jgi:hypothetical protein